MSVPTSVTSRPSTSPVSSSARSWPRSPPSCSGSALPSSSSPESSSQCSSSPAVSTSLPDPSAATGGSSGDCSHSGDASDARGGGGVLRHARDVRSRVGGVAPGPRRRDVAHRPHAFSVHRADDLFGPDRRSGRATPRATPRRGGEPDGGTVCTFSYGVLPSLWMLLGVSIIHAVADSFTMPGNQVAAALAGPPEQASSAQGLLGATGLAAAGLAGLSPACVRARREARRMWWNRGRHDRLPRHRDRPGPRSTARDTRATRSAEPRDGSIR